MATTTLLPGLFDELEPYKFMPEHEMIRCPFAVGYWFKDAAGLFLIDSDRGSVSESERGLPIYTGIMELMPGEDFLDRGRFEFFSPEELEYSVTLRGHYNKLVDRSEQFDRLVQWIVLQQGMRWSMRWCTSPYLAGYTVRFSFDNPAGAVGFKLTWNDEVLE